MALALDIERVEDYLLHPDAHPDLECLDESGTNRDWRLAFDPDSYTCTTGGMTVDVSESTEGNRAAEAVLDEFMNLLAIDVGSFDCSFARETIGVFYESRVAVLSDADFDIFCKLFVLRFLKNGLEIAEAVPSFDLDQLELMVESIGRLIIFLNEVIQPMGSRISSSGRDSVVGIATSALLHDLGGVMLGLNASARAYLFRKKCGISDGKQRNYEEYLFKNFDQFVLFARQVLGSNLKLAQGVCEFSDVVVRDALEPGLLKCADQFPGYELRVFDECDDIDALMAESGFINLVCDTALVARIDPDMIGLTVFNDSKNPIKAFNRTLGRGEGEKKISVIVNVEKFGEDCIAIFIRDSGIGISYDQQRDHLTEVALGKQSRGEPLSLVEELLLSEYWRDAVPPRVLNRQLLKRGVSLAGGTGIGLHLSMVIIEQIHNGRISVYDHPEFGAGVRIILPAINGDDPVERGMVVTDALAKAEVEDLPCLSVA